MGVRNRPPEVKDIALPLSMSAREQPNLSLRDQQGSLPTGKGDPRLRPRTVMSISHVSFIVPALSKIKTLR